jgi:hypothetical protein
MKSAKAVRETPVTANVFRAGQMWKIGDVNLAVTSVGKTLVHYKQYTTQPKGVQTSLSSKLALEKYLVNSRAVLVEQ